MQSWYYSLMYLAYTSKYFFRQEKQFKTEIKRGQEALKLLKETDPVKYEEAKEKVNTYLTEFYYDFEGYCEYVNL